MDIKVTFTGETERLARKVIENLEEGFSYQSPRERGEWTRWVVDSMQRAESPMESLFISAFATTEYLRPICQYRIEHYRVDFAIPDVKLVIEVDGADFHSTKDARARDHRRDGMLMLDGWRILRYTGSEIWANASECIDQVHKLRQLLLGQFDDSLDWIRVHWWFEDARRLRSIRCKACDAGRHEHAASCECRSPTEPERERLRLAREAQWPHLANNAG